MTATRRLLAALLLVALSFTATACKAEGGVGEGGIEGQIEGEDGGEGDD